jgi:tRNA(fMet)-specific endonuclease VapC
MIVADSDVLIDYLRGRNPMAARVELELQSRSFCTTAVTAFELWAGAKTPRQTSAVELLLGAMNIIPLEEDGARRASDVRKELLARGEDIGMVDSLIAGICLNVGGTLLTRNRRLFERIPSLKLSFSPEASDPAR